MQSAIILCYISEEDATKCFDAICEYVKTHPAPKNFYIDQSEFKGMPVPYAIGILFHEAHLHIIDNFMCKMKLPASDDVYSGVSRATEFNLYSDRKRSRRGLRYL